ncbi:uncharacterized protein BDV14DRAFT_199394 [Aspergillus stella-maris]|uniref:uncharacterized protein n=1 Tax=Aspergillus stella-maris TaxID=1810926 RepID=UPI003CCCC967
MVFGLQMDDQKEEDNLHVTDVARFLDEAGVASILFGWQAMVLVGTDTCSKKVGFVVKEDELDSATNTLADKEFHRCTNPECPELSADRLPADFLAHWEEQDLSVEERVLTQSEYAAILSQDRYHPVAAVHYHIADKYPEYAILALHRRSYLLWRLPKIPLASPADGDRNLMLSTDDRLNMENSRSGPWTELYPIKILTPWAFVEALIILCCRNFYHFEDLGEAWDAMLRGFAELDRWEIKNNIDDDFRASWDGLMGRGPLERQLWSATSPKFKEKPWEKGVKGLPLVRKNIWVPTRQLRDKLTAENKLSFLLMPKPEH